MRTAAEGKQMKPVALLFLACLLTSVLLSASLVSGEQRRDDEDEGLQLISARGVSNEASVQQYFECFRNTSALDNVPMCRGFISGVMIGGVLILLTVICICVCVGVCICRQCSQGQSSHRPTTQIQSPRRHLSGTSSTSASSEGGSQASHDDTTPLLAQATNVKVKKRWNIFSSRTSPRRTTGVVSSGNDLSTTPHYHNTHVPALVVHCVREIERKGLTSEGLYRKSGSLLAIREVEESLLHGDSGHPGLERVDVNVLCGVLKHYLRNLREPIITLAQRDAFITAAVSDDDQALHSVISQLPLVNKDTLSFLMLHLQKVATHCDENKMDKSNLAKVLGPTIVGHAESNPQPLTIQTDIPLQIRVTLKLLEISGDYWWQHISLASESLLSQ